MQELILIHKSLSADKAARSFAGTKWVFLGREYSDSVRWEKALGSGQRIDYKTELDQAAYGIRDEYVGWLAQLGQPHWRRWQWWITGFATRNNLSSPAYLYVCYLEALSKVLEKTSLPVVVISESWELLDALYTNFRGHLPVKRPFALQSRVKKNLYFIKEILHLFFVWSQFFMRSIYESLAALLTRVPGRPKPECVLNARHVVLHSCIDDACIGENGDFKDRYFPGLAEYLTRKGFRVSVLVWISNVRKKNLFSVFRWFRGNKRSFLIPQDYYSIFDCFFSFISVIRSANLRFEPKKCFFEGLDLFPLVEMERRRQYYNVTSAYFINQIKMFDAWKKKGYRLAAYVDTWELRNCEVPALVGIKKNYPFAKTIAYQHSALIAKLELAGYKTTKDEFAASVHSDAGIANSQVTRAHLLKEGFPESYIKLGPALRFTYLDKKTNTNARRVIARDPERSEGARSNLKNGIACLPDRQASPSARNDILVCLPIKASNIREMLEVCYRAFLDHPQKILIKPHPMTDFKKVKKELSFSWPDNFQVAGGDIGELLDQAGVVVTSASSIMVESVFKGIQTVILSSRTDIDIVPLDIIENTILLRKASTPEQLRRAVEEDAATQQRWVGASGEDIFEFKMDLLDGIFTT